jgi:hypothetical protein
MLLGAAAVVSLRRAGASPPPPQSGKLGFSVWRNGDEIGTHTVEFGQDGDRTVVRSEAKFDIRLGPIVLFRYRYRVSESWRDGLLQSFSARTDDNGTAEFADAEREGDRMRVTGSKSGRYLAPPGAIAATHWNPAELDQPMINPQNGELMRFERNDLGEERLMSGVLARHVALSGYATLDLWYDEGGTWRALRAVATDGSLIDYRPL